MPVSEKPAYTKERSMLLSFASVRSVWFLAAVLGSAVAVEGSLAAGAEPAGTLLVYVGTYTQGGSRGIYRFTLDLASGKLSPAGDTDAVANPSFLAIHPEHRFLYAVNEVGK